MECRIIPNYHFPPLKPSSYAHCNTLSSIFKACESKIKLKYSLPFYFVLEKCVSFPFGNLLTHNFSLSSSCLHIHLPMLLALSIFMILSVLYTILLWNLLILKITIIYVLYTYRYIHFH